MSLIGSVIGSVIIFLLAVVVLGYIPGRLALRSAGLSVTGLDSVALSLNLGFVISGIIFWGLGYFSVQQYLILYALAGAGIFVYYWRNEWGQVRLYFKGPQLLLVMTILIGVALLAILPVFYANITLTPDGRLRLSPLWDVFLHTAIANELTHSVPPQTPVFSGQPLNYHVGADIVTAMLTIVTGLPVADLTVRFVPTLFLIMTMLSAFCFARSWLASDYAAVFVTFLVFFGEDFSFIPGLLQGSKADWSVAYFSAPTTFSLFCVNPMLPGLGLLFAVLLCLANAFRERRFSWQLIAGLLFIGLAECKILTAGHLGISLAVCGVIYLVVFRNPRMLQAGVVAGVCSLPIIIRALSLNANQAHESVTFFQTHYLQTTLQQLGLATQLAWLPLPVWFAISLFIYLLGSLGLRVIGVPVLLKDLLRPRKETEVHFLVAMFVVIGVVGGLALSLVPKGIPSAYNNGIWFYTDSKYAMWIFGVEGIYVLVRTRTRSIAQGAVIAVIGLMLSVPSAIKHFMTFRSTWGFDMLPAPAVAALEFLKTNSAPGEVVLSPLEIEVIGPILVLTKCHVPIGPYVNNLAPLQQVRRRYSDLENFWADWRSGVARTEILHIHRINYVLVNKKRELPANEIPGLTVMFENAEWIIYRVTPNQPPHRAASKHPLFHGSDEIARNVSS